MGLATLATYFKDFGLNSENEVYLTSEKVKIELTEETPLFKGVYQIQFLLKNPRFDGCKHHLGDSLLIIEEAQATWAFFGQ